MWCTEPVDERREHFYAERFAPTLEPILAEEFDAVLVTHGPAVVRDGRAAPPGCDPASALVSPRLAACADL